jgi:esterase
MNAHLHVSSVGDGPAVILLHGLFGSGGNLGSLARSLKDRYLVHSVDLPNHGRSSWVEESDLGVMAGALAGWMQEENLPRAAVIGHSLGGKVAMQLALSEPGRVASLVVADIAPVEYPPGHDAVFAALEAVANSGCRSRTEAASLMADHLQEEGVIQFLLTSLRRQENGTYDWRFNLLGLKQDYPAARAAPQLGQPYCGPVMFIKGGDSDYIVESQRAVTLALFPDAQMKVMPGCGHWPHAQRPELFNGLVGRFLDAQSD